MLLVKMFWQKYWPVFNEQQKLESVTITFPGGGYDRDVHGEIVYISNGGYFIASDSFERTYKSSEYKSGEGMLLSKGTEFIKFFFAIPPKSFEIEEFSTGGDICTLRANLLDDPDVTNWTFFLKDDDSLFLGDKTYGEFIDAYGDNTITVDIIKTQDPESDSATLRQLVPIGLSKSGFGPLKPSQVVEVNADVGDSDNSPKSKVLDALYQGSSLWTSSNRLKQNYRTRLVFSYTEDVYCIGLKARHGEDVKSDPTEVEMWSGALGGEPFYTKYTLKRDETHGDLVVDRSEEQPESTSVPEVTFIETEFEWKWPRPKPTPDDDDEEEEEETQFRWDKLIVGGVAFALWILQVPYISLMCTVGFSQVAGMIPAYFIYQALYKIFGHFNLIWVIPLICAYATAFAAATPAIVVTILISVYFTKFMFSKDVDTISQRTKSIPLDKCFNVFTDMFVSSGTKTSRKMKIQHHLENAKQFFENTGEKITDGVADLKDKFEDGAADLKDKIEDGVADLKDKFEDGAADLKDKFDDGAADLKDKFDDGLANLKDKFEKPQSNPPKRTRKKLIDIFKKKNRR
jgi:hypothetical protein